MSINFTIESDIFTLASGLAESLESEDLIQLISQVDEEKAETEFSLALLKAIAANMLFCEASFSDVPDSLQCAIRLLAQWGDKKEVALEEEVCTLGQTEDNVIPERLMELVAELLNKTREESGGLW